MRNSVSKVVVSFSFFLGTVSLFSGSGAAEEKQSSAYRVVIQTEFPQKDLLKQNLEIFRYLDNPLMDRAFFNRLVEKAKQEIATVLATEGYFSPEIGVNLQETDGVLTSIFKVLPGQPSRIRSISLFLTGEIEKEPPGFRPVASEIKSSFSLEKEMVFRQEEWEKAKRQLLQKCRINSYPAARIIQSRALVNPEERAVDLCIEVDSGPAFTVGALEISGLSRYPRRIIENIYRIQAGTPYKQQLLFDFQSSLMQTGYFNNVEVRAKIDPQFPHNTPIIVKVVEKPKKKVDFEVSLSDSVGPGARIVYSDLGFTEGTVQMKQSLDLNGVAQSIATDFLFPQRLDGTRNSLKASFTHKDLQGERTKTLRFGFSHSEPAGVFEHTIEPQYQREWQGIAGQTGTDNRQALTLNSSWFSSKVDNALYPTKGTRLQFQVGGALKGLLSGQTFLRGYAKGIRFLSKTEKDVFALRGEAGIVLAESRDGIPSDFLFRAGGNQSIRGYPYDSIGVQEDDAVAGGRYLAVASMEYTRWWNEKWGTAVFIDCGAAGDTADDMKPVTGYGVGLRLRTVFGPVKLDAAYGERDEIVRFHFTAGSTF